MTDAVTPAPAATPAQAEPGINPPAATSTPPATPAAGDGKPGTVTIPVSEYAQLNRDAARVKSFDKRTYTKPPVQTKVNPDDPAAAEIAAAVAAKDAAEQRAMQLEVRGKVRDLLADDRFKDLPQTTKDLILQSPHMLSSAATLDEAMYDIEDKLLEMAGKVGTQPSTTTPQTPAQKRETPPSVSAGAPAQVDAGVLEDVTNLRGPERSQAVLRNIAKKAASAGK